MSLRFPATLLTLCTLSFPVLAEPLEAGIPADNSAIRWNRIPSPEWQPNGLSLYQALGEPESGPLAWLGSFNLYPTLGLGAGYDDNLYLTERQEGSDHFYQLRPALTLLSDWDRHAFQLNAGWEANEYADTDSEDHENWWLRGNGRLDLADSLTLSFTPHTERLTEDRFSVEQVRGQQEPTEYRQDGYQVKLDYNDRNLPYYGFVSGSQEWFDYEDAGSTNYDDRDMLQQKAAFRIGRRIHPEWGVFLEPSFEQSDFDEATDNSGVNRDADILSLLAGTTYEVDDLIYVDIGLGVSDVRHDDPTLEDNRLLNIATHFLWNPTELFSADGRIYRNGVVTTLPGTSEIILTGGALQLHYAVLENVIARFRNEYFQAAFEGQTREDDNWLSGLGAEYIMNEHVRLQGEYSYQTRDSNAAGQSFDDNRVTLQLVLGL